MRKSLGTSIHPFSPKWFVASDYPPLTPNGLSIFSSFVKLGSLKKLGLATYERRVSSRGKTKIPQASCCRHERM